MGYSTFLPAAVVCATVLVAWSAGAQEPKPTAKQAAADAQLLRVPISGYVIGGKPRGAAITNPYENDRQALVQGRMLFDAMNCSGCHAAEGGGGMGPPLSDNDWIYGNSPGNIYLTISQGRPNGMPSFENLGADSIWKLVAYVRSLSGLHQ
jgi:cytochrome c oxidase cbb3-type subunit III